jgi:RNA polymerase sigma-70 factor (ECF subfamily)
MDEMAEDSAETEGLLAQVCTGDRAAFDRLFALHRPYLHKVIALRLDGRLRARVDPSDVVQEAQLEAYRRLPDFVARRPMSFRLWLRKTAQQRLVMLRRVHLGAARRDAGREVPWPDDSALNLVRAALASGPTPSQELVCQEKAQQVREAVAQLPDAEGEILVLRNLEGLSNTEAAEVLEIDPSTASRRYGRALLLLREILVSCGIKESQS